MDRSVAKVNRVGRWLDWLVSTRNRRPASNAIVVYIHVPKAGGMSMTRMLRDVYGDQLGPVDK